MPKLRWQPCGAQFPGFDCAVATVPLDYDRPNGATTKIALSRKPAPNTANRIGSLFVNPGGPGGSGVDFVLRAGDRLSDQLEGRFDIIGFDPRGVAASDPLHCFDSRDDFIAFFDGLPVFPYQRAQERPYFDRLSSLADECFDDDGTIARHMSTADVVRDLDLLRRAVGDRKLSYLGFSYGSFIGNTYANLFPNSIRALVIDGVLDPRLWSSGWQIRSDRVATAQEFAELLRLCDEAASACAFHTPQGSSARWEALADSVRAHPIDLGGGNLYTYDLLINDPVRTAVVVGRRRLLRMADRRGPVHRPVADPDLGTRSGGRQPLRRGHRLRRRAGQRPEPGWQPAARLRRLRPHRLRPQRMLDRPDQPVPAQRCAAGRGHGVPGQPQPVPARGTAGRRAAGRPGTRLADALTRSTRCG